MLLEINFHHIGMMVEHLEKAVTFYGNIFDTKVTLRRESLYIQGHENLQVVFLQNNNFIIELIGPVKSNDSVSKIHIALIVTDILAFIENLKANKVKYEMFRTNNGDIDFIKFLDPELNMFEVSSVFKKH